MIRLAVVANVLGRFLLGFAVVMLLPAALSVLEGGVDLRPLAYSIAATAGVGFSLTVAARRRQVELSLREGLLLAVAVWSSACLFGALPFYFSPHFPTFSDAVFESASGFTTTGATVLPRVEVLSMPIQFWRCATHWFGGMGILVLVIAILPLLGAGGMHLYRAEFSGAKSDKLKPRITETALSLWKIYLALTFAEFVALRIAGMTTFEAVCHAFSTLGTGGFSTRTASVAGFDSVAIEYIIILFMLLAGINFTRHYRLWVERRPRSFFFDPEIRAYALVFAAASALIFVNLWGAREYDLHGAFRAAAFQASSILTSTGFVTADFERWPPFSQLLLLSLMFVGGCTGSTAGGLKVARIVLVLRVVSRELKRIVERRGVFTVRFGGHPVPETAIQSALNIFYLSFMVNFAASLLLTAAGIDVLTAISAVAACMFNVGPGLGSVGPAEHFGHLPQFAKWVLVVCMVAGRLEFYTLLVICAPSFWRK